MLAETIHPSIVFPEILFIDCPTFEDERGFFREYFRFGELQEAVGHPVAFVQANHSRSKHAVLRGIHVASYEKLIYVLRGEALVVLVDLREESPNFGKHEMLTLGDSRRTSVYVPAGFGNSFYVSSEEVEYCYLVSEYYDPTKEKNVQWDDPDLAIPWPDKNPVLSSRDQERAKSARELYPKRFQQ